MNRDLYKEIKMMRGQKHYYYESFDYFEYVNELDMNIFIFWMCYFFIITFT
jgi:hypothetical protein